MTNLISLFAILILFACNNIKKVTDKNATTSTTQNTLTTDTNHHFSVSFISIGAGTDGKAKQQYDIYIMEYGQKNKIKLNYEITHWGKEGEVDYCFKLNELDKKQQEIFVTETKEVLKNSTLVRYKENTTCRNKKQ